MSRFVPISSSTEKHASVITELRAASALPLAEDVSYCRKRWVVYFRLKELGDKRLLLRMVGPDTSFLQVKVIPRGDFNMRTHFVTSQVHGKK